MADRLSYRPVCDDAPHVREKPPVSNPTIEIRTRDGRVLVRRPDGVPGDPRHPVTQELLEKKFRDCVSFSAKPIPARNIDRAVKMIRDPDNVPDATEIIRRLS